MADPHHPDDLADLRALVAAQQAQLAAQHGATATLRADLARLARRRRLPRRLLPPLLAALLVALIPLATLAANPFTDLNANSPHNNNIDAIFNAGITKGCDTTAYCPNGLVTREEMASFLARTAGLGGNPPVANAKSAQSATTAQSATNAQNAVTAQTAANATQLGGQPASAYQLAGQPIANATNAQTLQGRAPNSLLRAAIGIPTNGFEVFTPIQFASVNTATIVAPSDGFLLATGNATLSTTSATCTSPNCQVAIRLRQGGAASGHMGDSIANEQTRALAMTQLFQVAAGTHTVDLQAGISPGNTFSTGNTNLSVVFIPFGADGGTRLTP